MLPEKTNSAARQGKGIVARAAARFREARRGTRIGFVIDATGSRARQWEQAQTIQARMFRAAGRRSGMHLRLVHYGGGALCDHGWQDSPRNIAAAMARVRCRSGLTQILPALSRFADDGPDGNAKAIILIGDAFEEDPEEATRIGAALKVAGIRLYAFLEGEDWTAADAFRRLAEMTGGRFARFGDDLPLDELCQGVALLSAGGDGRLRRLKHDKVRRLLLEGPKE